MGEVINDLDLNLMRRPLFVSAVFLCFGILSGYYWQGPLLACLAFLLALCCCLNHYCREKWMAVWVLPLFFLVGLFLSLNSMTPNSALYHQAAEDGGEACAIGVVQKADISGSGQMVAYLKINFLQTQEGESAAIVKVKAYLGEARNITAGQQITVRGTFRRLEEQRNPGGFNEFLYLKSRKIEYKLYGEVVGQPEGTGGGAQFLYALRARFSDVFDSVLPEKESGLMRSIILGDRTGLDDDIAELYKIAGVYHIVVISGLHITVLMLAVYRLLSRFLSLKISSCLTMAFLVFYCVLVGGGVSVVRAVLMAGVLILGKVLFKEGETVASASFAGILLLLYEPLYLFDAGFQLSFAAVYGIGFFAGPMEALLQKKGEKVRWIQKTEAFKELRSGFITSITVFLWTAPVMMWHFNYIALYSVFANVLIIPFSTLLVGGGFLTGILGLFAMAPAKLLGQGCYGILKIYETVCLLFSELPYAQPNFRHYPLWIVALYYLLLGFMVLRIKEKNPFAKGRRALAAGAGFAVVVFYYNALPAGPSVMMLDVGQGDCFVIEAEGKVFLVDGSGWGGIEIGKNTGVKVLMPYLAYRGIDRVDTAFISHTDLDHCAGIIELMAEGKVDRVVLPVTANRSDTYCDWIISLAEIQGIELIFMEQGDILRANTGISFESLYPFRYNSVTGMNENSLVLKMNCSGTDFLFTGDIGFRSEEILINAGVDVQTTVLKIAHHGSMYATADVFLEAADPALAIVSASQYNVYGHPSREVRDRLAGRGIPLYATADYGAVRIFIKNGGVLEVETMSEQWRSNKVK